MGEAEIVSDKLPLAKKTGPEGKEFITALSPLSRKEEVQ